MSLIKLLATFVVGLFRGIGAVAGAVAPMFFGLPTYPAFVIGAGVGTIVTDGLFAGVFGIGPETGIWAGMKKGISASAGGAVGLMGGLTGLILGAFAGALIGDLL